MQSWRYLDGAWVASDDQCAGMTIQHITQMRAAVRQKSFDRDEDMAHLGEQLILAPWLEARRAEIEAGLVPLTMPRPEA